MHLCRGGLRYNTTGAAIKPTAARECRPRTHSGPSLDITTGRRNCSKSFSGAAEQDDENFARFRPPDLATWPIDFMFVEDGTFNLLYADAENTEIGVAETTVVSSRHLVALKIHAMKTRQEHRFARDFNDVVALLRMGKTGLGDDELRELCI